MTQARTWHVKENDLPRRDYNASLESFDMTLTSPFDDETNGLIALIEILISHDASALRVVNKSLKGE